ncbi:Pyridoxal-dependent decarboxylase conserved domain-containing protein [Chitinophaga sp. YR627]|uniref:pyridoxal-dependent decarboxylase n=1 Tax=Chitinophaga sp. YR627 TaxID=1881041 RepID=UPI0008EFD1B2|nr:pyridoxal-dependent decarboxylase [Chitinophaga sp. YR627]SFO28089.1 Pyridoxal-dependent decarboxylase conserved domain-containing protein [Chitinophaga sp. YR627]
MKQPSNSKKLFARQLQQQQHDILSKLRVKGTGSDDLAGWFLGPKAENTELLQQLIQRTMDNHCNDRKNLYPNDPVYVTEEMKQTPEYQETVRVLQHKLDVLLEELKGSVPFWSYRWQSHMNWDTTLPSMVGYFGTMLYNPNNVAAEASPVTTVLEMIVGDELCKMLGYNITDTDPDVPKAWGHITCDGSIANNEAMWAARNLKYYSISLAAAIKDTPELSQAGALQLKLANGTITTIGAASSWDLLNLSVDEVLSIPDRLQSEFGINLDLLTQILNNYSIQNIGFDGINKFLDSGIQSPSMMAASTCHYSWPKSAAVLGLGANNLIKVYVDENARLHIGRLREELQKSLDRKSPVLMVVAVIGSTEESAVDPLKDIVAVREEFRQKGLNFVIHGDAAWGGYFASILRQPEHQVLSKRALLYTPTLTMNDYVTEQYANIQECDSITIDPHKAGYIPYPAGGLCYKNGAMRNLVAFTAPVVYHGGIDPTVGIYGLEGSKPGAAAAAAYLSHQVIPLDQSGYGQILGKCLFNSKRLYSAFITMAEPDDPFIIVPFQRLPAEKHGEGPQKIKEQYDFIKNEIVPKTNEEIMSNAEAVKLLPELGSDQIIITYTFNFKENGVLNKDVDKLNELNLNIFQALSLSPGEHDHPSKTPMYVTQSQFDNDSYGKSFVNNYKERLGLSTDNDEPVNILISTTMNPWLTDTADGNFIPELVKALRQTVLEQVEKVVGAMELA